MSTANTNPAHEEIKTPLTWERIAQDLLAVGLAEGDIVLVHTSMKALGHVDGGPATVIDAFLEVLGEAGTLVFPSFQAGSEHELLRNGCVFDVRSSPAGTGLLPETFQRRPGVIRSLSPTHCMAGFGKLAAELLAGQSLGFQ